MPNSPDYSCPKDGKLMMPYISLLAPTYETYMCENCGGIFYDLTDEKQLNEIIKKAQSVMAENIKNVLPSAAIGDELP